MRFLTICVEISGVKTEEELQEELSLAFEHLDSYKGWSVEDMQLSDESDD